MERINLSAAPQQDPIRLYKQAALLELEASKMIRQAEALRNTAAVLWAERYPIKAKKVEN